MNQKQLVINIEIRFTVKARHIKPKAICFNDELLPVRALHGACCRGELSFMAQAGRSIVRGHRRRSGGRAWPPRTSTLAAAIVLSMMVRQSKAQAPFIVVSLPGQACTACASSAPRRPSGATADTECTVGTTWCPPLIMLRLKCISLLGNQMGLARECHAS